MKSRKSPIGPSYCCIMSWISSWNTPATTTAIAPGKIARRTTGGLARNAAPSSPAIAPPPIRMATPAARPSCSVSMSNRSADNAMKIACSGTIDITTASIGDRRARRGAGEQSRKRAPRHRAGTARDQQQRRLPEAQHIDDDPALVHREQHADRRQVHRAGAEGEADERGAAHHARFLAMRSPSSPCGRKISTMISSVKAIRSRNW